ncbi:MAG TPA: helix-turn-helix transcriptional regulator [Pirellulales bacterium]|nr:helix-turn-helix transcriptional regulator [Pirellulales bacterium]
MYDVAANLRRLMARFGLTLEQVVEQSGLNQRTVRGILAGTHKPHARTLNRLAVGLGVAADELFQDPSLLAHRAFDRQTNPVVEAVASDRPELFIGWAERDFDELYSRFGTGGSLTVEGTLAAVQSMNHNREIHRRVALILESGEAAFLSALINLLYERIQVH